MASGGLTGLNEICDVTDNEINLIVKFNNKECYCLDVDSETRIEKVKQLLSIETNTNPNNISLVLAGRMLPNATALKDCGLGGQTTLHAFRWSDDGLSGEGRLEGEMTDLTNSNQTDVYPLRNIGNLQITTEPEVSASDQSRFFVFCKICQCVRKAKLRVCCKECGSGAFLVNKGPDNWQDISSRTSISGVCKSSNCSSKVPKFYLLCAENHKGETSGTSVVLRHVQANHPRVECVICGDVASHVLIFPCVSGHVICLECFRQYCHVCLSERRFVEHPQHGYTLPCPVGCEDSFIEENHHFLLMGTADYERYKNFGAEEFVLQNGGLLCPAPGCGMGLFPDEGSTLIKCRECEYETCASCRQAYHIGECRQQSSSSSYLHEFEIDEGRAERACWEKQSMSLIQETTKPCPGCRAKTEKDGGCMHMVCCRCGCEWCWLCEKLWDRSCQGDHWFG